MYHIWASRFYLYVHSTPTLSMATAIPCNYFAALDLTMVEYSGSTTATHPSYTIRLSSFIFDSLAKTPLYSHIFFFLILLFSHIFPFRF